MLHLPQSLTCPQFYRSGNGGAPQNGSWAAQTPDLLPTCSCQPGHCKAPEPQQSKAQLQHRSAAAALQPSSSERVSLCVCVSVRRAVTNSLLSLGDQCSHPTTSPIMAVGVTREAKHTDRPLVPTVYLSCPSSRKLSKGYCKSCLNNTLTQWGRFTGKALCQR